MTGAVIAQVMRAGLVAGQVFRCDNGTKDENLAGGFKKTTQKPKIYKAE